MTLFLQELQLSECNQLLNTIGFKGSDYDKFKLLSITGGVPRYLEEIQPHLPAEANIQELYFRPGSVLVQEFNDICNDLFSQRSDTYKKIVGCLVHGVKEIDAIAKEIHLSTSGYLSHCLEDLMRLGFIRRDFSWNLKNGTPLRNSHFRLSDNYLRFYLKYIEPYRSKIEPNHFPKTLLAHMPAWDSMMGLQFENMVVSSRELIWKQLPLSTADIVNDNPFFQKKTTRMKGCQIDYMIQTRFQNLFVCEVKFSKNKIGSQVIEDMKEKIGRIALPRGFSCWPVLIHVNGVTEDAMHFICDRNR